MLLYAQDEIGYISPAVMAEVAARIGIQENDVLSVLSYYSLLRTKPAGKFNVQVCTNICCMLRGGNELFEHCSKRLGVGHKGSRPTASSLSKRSSALEPAAGHPPSRSTTTFTRTSRRSRWTRSSTSYREKAGK